MRWQKWFTFTVYYKNNTHLRVFSFRDIVVLGHVANGLSRTGQILTSFMLTDVVGHFTQTAGLNCQLSLEALKLSLIFMDFHRFWRISISCYKLLISGYLIYDSTCVSCSVRRAIAAEIKPRNNGAALVSRLLNSG